MLTLIRAVHTFVWAVFVACIAGVYVFAARAQFAVALILIGVVLVEVVVLVGNGMRCPLTDLAARHTDDRAENFDIWLPRWLARHNQQVFGALYVGGVLFTGARWLCER
ncbi:MAG: hypothetical protein AB7O97_06320 [Planctomycetota bacterium]